MDNLLFVGTGDGVLVYQLESGAWRKVRRGLEGKQVTCLTNWNHSVLAGTTDGLFSSTDNGEQWKERSQGLTERHIRSVAHTALRPVKMLAGTEPAAAFHSTYCSETWIESPQVAKLRDRFGWYLPYSPEAGCVRGFAFDGERAYAAVEQGGVLVSEDGGSNWQMAGGSTGETDTPPPESGLIHPDVHSIYTHPSSPGWVWASTGGGLYLSRKSGKKWERLYRCYCRSMWVDPRDAAHVVFGPADGVDRQGRIEVTGDGGQTWKMASKGLDVPWPSRMVEQFVQVQNRLIGVLSNGELIAAPLDTLHWSPILPGIKNARAAAAASLQN